MSKFRVLVPAAGRSLRFLDAGYETLKPDLELRRPGESTTRSMIDWVLSALPHTEIGPVVVGAHPLLNGPSRPHVRYVTSHTRGQAQTLHRMLTATCPIDEPILVLNADVVFSTSVICAVMRLVDQGADVGIAVHESESTAYSYVNSFPYPTKFAEKLCLSKYAMSGVWAFRSPVALRERLEKVCLDMIEPFLSHGLGRLPGVKECHLIEPSDFADLGTPDAVRDAGWEIVSEK